MGTSQVSGVLLGPVCIAGIAALRVVGAQDLAIGHDCVGGIDVAAVEFEEIVGVIVPSANDGRATLLFMMILFLVDLTPFLLAMPLQFLAMMKKMPDSENELQEAFKAFDADGDGTTSEDELKKILAKFGQTLTDNELFLVMAAVDTDGDGEIDYNEFKRAMEA